MAPRAHSQGMDVPCQLESSSSGPRTGLPLCRCIIRALLGPVPAGCEGMRAQALARSCGGNAVAGNGVLRSRGPALPSFTGQPGPGPGPAAARFTRSRFRGHRDEGPGDRGGPGAVREAAAGVRQQRDEGGVAPPPTPPLAAVGYSRALFCIFPTPRQLCTNRSAGAAVSLAYAPLPWARSCRGCRTEVREGRVRRA